MPDASAGPSRLLEHAAYVAVALGAVCTTVLSPEHIVGDGVDMYGTFWFYWWISECVAHLQRPGFTDLMFFPLGKDIFAHTGNNFVDAVVAAPFVWLLGYPRFQPFFIAFVLWGNALTMRGLARHLAGEGRPGGPSWGAWATTLLWQVAPFTLFELMTGRVTQAFLWFLPPAVLWFLRIGVDGPAPGATGWRRTWGQVRAPVLAGLFTAAQAYTYWFMGYFMALAFGWMAVAALLRPPAPRGRLLLGWLVAGLVCVAVVAPAAVSMVQAAGAGDVPGLPEDRGLFDKPAQVANNVSTTLHGYALLEASGQPMFAYLVWGGGLVAVLALGRDRLRWAGVLGLTFLFALGPALPAETGAEPRWNWPYLAAFNALPFFDRLWFPYRLVVMAFLVVAVGIGGLVARLDAVRARRAPRVPGWALPLGLLALTCVEQHRHLAYPLLHRALPVPETYRLIGAQGGALVELPIGLARISILWQPVHGQPTFGGMAENAPVFWPAGYKRRFQNTLVRRLRQATRDPTEIRDHKDRDLQKLLGEGYRWVVLDRRLVDADMHRWTWGRTATPEALEQAPFLAMDRVTEALGPPTLVEGELVTWDLVGGAPVPVALRPDPNTLRTRTWSTDEMPEYERHLREIGRIPEP